MISLLCLFVALVVSHFGFVGRTLVLIASVPGHCDYLLLEYAVFFRKRSIPASDVGYRTVSLLHFHPACNVFYLAPFGRHFDFFVTTTIPSAFKRRR